MLIHWMSFRSPLVKLLFIQMVALVIIIIIIIILSLLLEMQDIDSITLFYVLSVVVKDK